MQSKIQGTAVTHLIGLQAKTSRSFVAKEKKIRLLTLYAALDSFSILFFLNKECSEGPGSFSLNSNGGGIQYYKGPHKIQIHI
jgi:hypothetical protein